MTKIVESYTGLASNLEEVRQWIENDQSIFPFNEHGHLICNLKDTKFFIGL